LSTTDLLAGVNNLLGEVKTRQAVNKALHALRDEGNVEKMTCAPGDSQFGLWLDEGGAND